MKIHLPPHEPYIGTQIPKSDYIIKEFLKSGNNALLFRAHNPTISQDHACKIIPKENQAENWQEEVLKPNRLTHSAVVQCHHASEWNEDPSGSDTLVLCLDYIEGYSLKEYIANNKNNVSIAFIEAFLGTMFNLLFEMKGKSIKHGDLHSGNILVEEEPASMIVPTPMFKVTDFGVRSATSGSDFKDDYLQLAVILKELLEQVNYTSASGRDKFAWNILNDYFLAKHLVEVDVSHDPFAKNPTELFGLLKKFDLEYNKLKEEGKERLETPFDYLSCEQIGSSYTILNTLYSEKFIGLGALSSKNNLMLTGPRGCGKTTIFKSLSLRHRFLSKKDSPENIDYIGIYLRCDELYFAFPRFKNPEKEEAVDVPVHFLTASILIEILDSLEEWGKRHFEDSFNRNEENAISEVWTILGINKPVVPKVDSFKVIKERLLKEKERAAKKRLYDPNQKFGSYFGVDKLLKSCEALQKNFDFLTQRPFYFFIDDYSIPKITEDLQMNLNRLLMLRSACCFFKISTESPVSFQNKDIDGKSYVEGREYNLVNLGLNFISAGDNEKLEFIEDVFERRLSSVEKYPVKTLGDLIGDDLKRKEIQVAKDYRDKKTIAFWGKSVLVKLCSGDIFYLINLVKGMVDSVGGEGALADVNEVPKIPPSVQNKSIKREAGNFLKNLRDLPNGEQLVKIVNAFGNVAQSYIRFKEIKNDDGSMRPHQACRIEPLSSLALSDKAEVLYGNLIRYSIFLEDVRGKSQRGKIVPRLYLRKFLIPFLNLTFSTKDSLRLEPHEIEKLLLAPDEFEKSKKLTKEPVLKNDDNDKSAQGDLFVDDKG